MIFLISVIISTSNKIERYVLDGIYLYQVLASTKQDIYDISWVSGDFLGFGYFKGKAVHFIVSLI